MGVKVLVVDNYDSFVYTLVAYIRRIGAEAQMIRHDELSLQDTLAAAAQHDGVLISPGPGSPSESGVCPELVRWCGEQHKPLFGVCLGHQVLAEAYGGLVGPAPELMHGKVSKIYHRNESVLWGLPTPFLAARYHSLAILRVPANLKVTAATAEGVVMAIQHTTAPLSGVQFHPESVLTDQGYLILGNWLETLGLEGARALSRALHP